MLSKAKSLLKIQLPRAYFSTTATPPPPPKKIEMFIND